MEHLFKTIHTFGCIPVLIACKNAKVYKPKLMESYTYGAGPLEIDEGGDGI